MYPACLGLYVFIDVVGIKQSAVSLYSFLVFALSHTLDF
jgi:hypothetical protein